MEYVICVLRLPYHISCHTFIKYNNCCGSVNGETMFTLKYIIWICSATIFHRSSKSSDNKAIKIIDWLIAKPFIRLKRRFYGQINVYSFYAVNCIHNTTHACDHISVELISVQSTTTLMSSIQYEIKYIYSYTSGWKQEEREKEKGWKRKCVMETMLGMELTKLNEMKW